MESTEVEIETGERLVVDVTDVATRFLAARLERGDGLLSLFLPHATAGLALVETGSGSEEDLADALERLLPGDDRYRHRHGSPGHGRDHLVPALVSPSLVIPVVNGALALGIWQSIVVVDPNRDNRRRRLRLSFLAG